MRMPPEEDGDSSEEEGGEDDGDEDGKVSDQNAENSFETNCEVIIPRETFLDLLYLAARNRNGNENVHVENLNCEEGDGSYLSVNCSDDLDSDCDSGDYDNNTDTNYDDDEGDVEVILEEIRRISEALLGSTMSELVDAERRISLKSFDELAARDESLSSIMDEWDYEDSEVTDNNDCQAVVERIQLFMRSPSQRENGAANVRPSSDRPLATQRDNYCLAQRVCQPPANACGATKLFVVFFDPGKLGVFRKFSPRVPERVPKVKHTIPLKKSPRRIRFDKDSVWRWSEDDAKEDICRVLRGLHRESRRADACEPWRLTTPADDPGSTSGRTPFAVTLPVGVATAADLRIALYNNRVLEAEVVRVAGLEAGAEAGAAGAAAGAEMVATTAPGRFERCETVLVRRWAVPDGVDIDSFRCFLGEGILLVTSLPLPEGFEWPFVTPPTILGNPLRVSCDCDFVP